MTTTTDAPPSAEPVFVTAGALRRTIGIRPYVLMKGAAIGQIRTQVRPGQTPRYDLNDAVTYKSQCDAVKLRTPRAAKPAR